MTGLERKPNTGFTLVELQVALFLVTLIAVLMVGALRLGARTWHTVTGVQDVTEHRFVVGQFLRRHLASMKFIRVRTADGHVVTSFFGDENQLHFVAPYPVFDNDNEQFWWTLRSDWDAETGKYQLYMMHRPFSSEQIVAVEADGDLIIEMSGIAEADTENDNVSQPVKIPISDDMVINEISFFRRDYEGYSEWLDSWEPGNETPLIIRLILAEVDKDGNETLLPEIGLNPRYANQLLFSSVER